MLSSFRLLLLLALSPAAAWAQDAGGFDFDASIPDASVGEGGADRDQQEAEDQTGRVPTVCQDSEDCASGFSCRDRRCVWTGVRRATGGGCLGGGSAMLIFGTAFVSRSRKR